MIISRLRDFLESRGVRYQTLSHERAMAATEIAMAAGVPEEQMAKVVVVELDGRPAMVLVTAGARVDLAAVGQRAAATTVRLADELTCAAAFPDCEAGAQPALGNLYQLPVYVDHRLASQPMLTFNAGTHTRAIRMAWSDFARLVRPRLGRFSEAPLAAEA